MKIKKIKNRSILFTHDHLEWDYNIHLIMGDKYNYIIDTGLGSLSIEPVIKYIDNNKPIIGINTHYHWDHVWGNDALRDCTLISHELCSELIDSQWDDMVQKKNHFIHGEAIKCLPNLTFKQELYFPEDKIRLFYTPGHTIDSISILDEREKVLNIADNVGDTVDEILPNLACEKALYIDTLSKYKEIDFDICLSGHNIPLQKDVLDKILKEL